GEAGAGQRAEWVAVAATTRAITARSLAFTGGGMGLLERLGLGLLVAGLGLCFGLRRRTA
ncbi:MAG: hypothetical protein ACR2N4_11830, partial [Jatrophihabitans sp.]